MCEGALRIGNVSSGSYKGFVTSPVGSGPIGGCSLWFLCNSVKWVSFLQSSFDEDMSQNRRMFGEV